MLADLHTPAGIYLRLRDRFRDTILLESTDHHSAENSYSFIGIHAIAGIEIRAADCIEYKFPGQKPEKIPLEIGLSVPGLLWDFMQKFKTGDQDMKEARFAQGLYGYTGYEAASLFEPSLAPGKLQDENTIPVIRYRLYQYVIAINHFRDELFICENRISGLDSAISVIESLIRSRDVPSFPFRTGGEEHSPVTDGEYMEMVKKGITHCHRGDVFQLVLSRRFYQRFTGDEFNVYRALRSINPSPYLFYFDYGDYKLMGSSPESQLLVKDGKAVVHPIAGTFKRTGDDEADRAAAEKLVKDPKENAEHVMLVDLARNDLSRVCENVSVQFYRQVQFFSHVIHLVSEVAGKLPAGANPFSLLASTFPAGTLSGAPKYRAMELIREYEPGPRGFYGGAIGFTGFDGTCNHAILIRSFLSRQNTLVCQAGAGIVAGSDPRSELEEVSHKLGALRKAIRVAETLEHSTTQS